MGTDVGWGTIDEACQQRLLKLPKLKEGVTHAADGNFATLLQLWKKENNIIEDDDSEEEEGEGYSEEGEGDSEKEEEEEEEIDDDDEKKADDISPVPPRNNAKNKMQTSIVKGIK